MYSKMSKIKLPFNKRTLNHYDNYSNYNSLLHKYLNNLFLLQLLE